VMLRSVPHPTPSRTRRQETTGYYGFALLSAAIVVAFVVGDGQVALCANGPLTLRADHAMKPDGTLAQGVLVVLQDGKIKDTCFGEEAKKAKNARQLPPGAVVSPGLIDLFASIGAHGQASEKVLLIDPKARAADAIDPLDTSLPTAIRSGITTAMVAPAANNLVSGACVSFRTYTAGEALDVLRDDGPMVFALQEGVWQRERAPTSRAGAVHRLRNLITDASNANAPEQVNAVIAGQLDGLLICRSSHDLMSAADALGDLVNRFAIAHTADAIDMPIDAERLAHPVVVGPYTFTTNRRELLGAAALCRSGIDVAFRGGFPETAPHGLRTTAALAVRHGMAPAAARRAMTVAAAKVAGIDNLVGSLAPGKQADLVVFSGDPLRLDTTILEVYVRGTRVYCAANQKNAAAPGGQR